MKTRLLFLTLPIIFVMTIGVMIAAPFDSGHRLWVQPNGIGFTARQWGDEFFSWFETTGGYRIYQAVDGWYYYAMLDTTGEFTASTFRVGIDPPPASAYKLERSAARISQIQQYMCEFRTRYARPMQIAKQNVREPMTAPPETLKLAIILVEFTDTLHYRNPAINRPSGYLKSDFENEFYSSNNAWYDTTRGNNKHPEGDPVFGSFRDYWNQMSLGHLIITGKVVNPLDSVTGVAKWIKLSYNWAHYYNNSTNWHELADEGISKAQDSGYISSIPGQSNYYQKQIVIYAGKAVAYGSLKVHARDINASYTWIGERTGKTIYYENTAFLHIGTMAHEFGHLIGFFDQYNGGVSDDGHTDTRNYDLMAMGPYNGPLLKGECPASLAPFYRIRKNWVPPIDFNRDTTNFTVEYSYSNPKFYRIYPVDGTQSEHYLLETRVRQGFDLYTPNSPGLFQNQPGTLLIWHNNIARTYNGGPSADTIDLRFADNKRDTGSFLTDFYPNNFAPGRQSLNDLTVPGATLGENDSTTYDYNERPAHFALNGIHRLANNNTQIDTIALKLTMASGLISQNTTWKNDVLILGDVTVQSGTTLTILPGTKILCTPEMSLTINGKLIAKGTASQRITFTSTSATPAPGDWGGIVCSGGGPDTLTFCDINYGSTGLWLQNTAANSYTQNDTIRYSTSSGSGVSVQNTGTANKSLRR